MTQDKRTEDPLQSVTAYDGAIHIQTKFESSIGYARDPFILGRLSAMLLLSSRPRPHMEVTTRVTRLLRAPQ